MEGKEQWQLCSKKSRRFESLTKRGMHLADPRPKSSYLEPATSHVVAQHSLLGDDSAETCGNLTLGRSSILDEQRQRPHDCVQRLGRPVFTGIGSLDGLPSFSGDIATAPFSSWFKRLKSWLQVLAKTVLRALRGWSPDVEVTSLDQDLGNGKGDEMRLDTCSKKLNPKLDNDDHIAQLLYLHTSLGQLVPNIFTSLHAMGKDCIALHGLKWGIA